MLISPLINDVDVDDDTLSVLSTTVVNQKGFDVNFESSTDDAIVVYSVLNTNVAKDLAYKLLTASSSSLGITE